MGVRIEITGIARVTDDLTGKPLIDPKRVEKVAKLRENEETISEYFDAELEELDIKGGDIRLAVDPSGKGFLVISTFKAPRPLTKDQLDLLKADTLGQWSDGIGEGCFDIPATKHQVTIDLLQRNRDKVKVEQIDDGKPAKEKKPPSAAKVKSAELIDAADRGDLESLRALLAAGADPNGFNKNKVNALFCAAYEGHTDVVRELLATGVDVNGYYKNDRKTPLMAAAQGADEQKDQNVAVARVLVAAGADPSIVSEEYDSRSPLSWAVEHGAKELVRVLLEAGADPNLRDAEVDWNIEGNRLTPLMRVQHPEIAELLLAAGADPMLPVEDEDYPTVAAYVRSRADRNHRRSKDWKDGMAAADVIERHLKSAKAR